MAKIMNLTQHVATLEQTLEGVIDLPDGEGSYRKALIENLTFKTLPKYQSEVTRKAQEIAGLVIQYLYDQKIDPKKEKVFAMIGGAPYLMAPLEKALLRMNIMPVYSFSVRKSTEKVINGGVEKVSIFSHAGWIYGESPDLFWSEFASLPLEEYDDIETRRELGGF